ncbi:MAG: class I SAM-dependent methyltransferase [Gemmatimonadaceae bacterium]
MKRDAVGRRASGEDAWWRRLRTVARHRRARRALERQLAYQERKAAALAGREVFFTQSLVATSQRARAMLDAISSIDPAARVLEVGSGAHGLIFHFGCERSFGVDPLAHQFAALFPAWQRRVPTVAAVGEELPFGDAAFDIVLSDNVVDHAENPKRIVDEMVRVLAPGGLLYFAVHIHHPVYALASAAHGAWRSLGIPFEITPFADHTTHFTPASASRLFRDSALEILCEWRRIDEARMLAARVPPRHAGDRLKQLFFKNAVYEVIAQKSVG